MAKWMMYAKKEDFNAISRACGISPVLARVIRNRDVVGIDATKRFLSGTLSDLHDPGLLPDMEKAAALLSEKIRGGSFVRVIGDYDVDGICASFILMRALSVCGASADVVLPDRIRDGYGMNPKMAEEAVQDGVGVILTCDNGIAAAEAVRAAKEAGLCVIVTDHHEVPFESVAGEEQEETVQRKYILPPADAVVDPKIRDPLTGACAYPFPEICGAVVAWKLAGILLGGLAPDRKEDVLRELLPFCALATVCDVMPLRDENRILVREGLAAARETSNVGLRSLLIVNGLTGKPLSAYHAGFVIGPCLNATGRLDTAERALALFFEEDPQRALRSAEKLRELNDSRKSLTEQGVQNALVRIREENLLENRVLVIFLPDCHESLAGIIAGRIRERYCRPAFVLTRTRDGVAKGSGRSIEAYDMFSSLTSVRECLLRFGGHRMAAGLSLKEEEIPSLQKKLEENCVLTQDDLVEVLHIDMELPPSLWNVEMARELQLLEPCGTANPRPSFAARGIRLHAARVQGKARNVVRLEASDGRGSRITLVRFQDAADFFDIFAREKGRRAVDALLDGRANLPANVVYYPEINEWKGRTSLQYIVKDIRPV